MKRNIRGVYCHRLRRKIGPNHPWYLNEVKKRRKINPEVWVAMRERREFEIVAAENLKILQAKAPKSFNGTVLEYLTYDYTHSEKAILPSFLPLLKVDASFQELIFRLKFVKFYESRTR